MIFRVGKLFFSAVLFAACLPCSQASAWAQHDASVALSPLFGSLAAEGKTRTFYTVTGGAAHYSFYFSPAYAFEVGYDAQLIGTAPVLHGPDVGVTAVLWGARSFSFSEDSLFLKVSQPLSVSATAGIWFRNYNLKELFPAEVRTLEEYEEFVKPGSALGIAVSGNLRVQIWNEAALFVRARYATAATSDIAGGSFLAYSLQLGAITAL